MNLRAELALRLDGLRGIDQPMLGDAAEAS